MSARKMVALKVDETSGVDHPAHLHEGWLVVKSASPTTVEQILKTVQTNEQEGTIVSDYELSADDRLAEAEALIAKQADQIAELTDANAEVVVEPTIDEIAKSLPAPVAKAVNEALAKAAEATDRANLAEETLRKERDARNLSEAIEVAKQYEVLGLNAEEFGSAMLRVTEFDSELAGTIAKALDTVKAQADTASIFTEIGKSANRSTGDAYTRLTTLAKSAVENGSYATLEQARTEILMSDAELQSAINAERRA